MNLNLGSLFFNVNTVTPGGTPPWGTEMGQGGEHRFSFEGMNDFILGMAHKAIFPSKEDVFCPLGKGGKDQDKYEYPMAAIFDKVYVNGLHVKDGSFLLLVVKLIEGKNHVGRCALKFSPNITYKEQEINKDCFSKIEDTLAISHEAAWFVHKIEIANQDELHFTVFVMDKDKAVEFPTNDARKAAFASIISSAYDEGEEKKRPDYSPYITLLKSKKNMVLTGAPGTGKTFMAKEIAAALVGNCSWRCLSHGERTRVGFVQFHPSYDYTDFVEGLRPTKDNNFIRQDGVFKQFCKRALASEEPHVFIIDEINRGELSKIFGELFYSIEPDYRGKAGIVKTQYQNMIEDNDEFKNGFFIPKNVYIIGTMNDVDRGVEAMDFAIRRRFAWREVTAAESANNMGLSDETKKVMNALNQALNDNGLNEAYHIGGAYFLKLNDSDYKNLWKNHLKGIVTEYFRGEPEADIKVKKIETAYKKAQEEPKE